MISLLARDMLAMEVSYNPLVKDCGIERFLTSTRCLRVGPEEEVCVEGRQLICGYSSETWCQ